MGSFSIILIGPTSTKETAAEADGKLKLSYLTSWTVGPVWQLADWFVRSQLNWEKVQGEQAGYGSDLFH